MSRQLDLVLTGTGRCATGFFAQYLSSAGYPCGHERFFGPHGLARAKEVLQNYWQGIGGESSWLAAPFLDSQPLKKAFVVHLVRHPARVIESWLRVPPTTTPTYWDFAVDHLPGMGHIVDEVERAAYRYVHWNRLIEDKIEARPHLRFNVEHEPLDLLYQLVRANLFDMAQVVPERLFANRQFNTKTGSGAIQFSLSRVRDAKLRSQLQEIARRYGYTWEERVQVIGPERVRAVIASLDNGPILRQQLAIFMEDPVVSEVVVVNNASVDGTQELLAGKKPTTVTHRSAVGKEPDIQEFDIGNGAKPLHIVNWEQTVGAGPARNSGIDVPGQWDMLLFLDGGIVPLIDGAAQMLRYLKVTPLADVIGVEIADFRTDLDLAWRRWHSEIRRTYQNFRLSHTAYALARYRALDGIRFCEEGPFAAMGWGADDDEMMCRWRENGIVVHVVTCACKLGQPCSGVHPYRRASGSWSSILRKTGIEATAYGSAYEGRCVYLGQEWPQYEHNAQWGEPWLTAVVEATTPQGAAEVINMLHGRLRMRRFQAPHSHVWNPYSIVLWAPDANEELLEWAECHRLRQHQGTVALRGGQAIHRGAKEEPFWAGDFRVWHQDVWQPAVRPGAFYYGLVRSCQDAENLLAEYSKVWPAQFRKRPGPQEGRKELLGG